MEKNKEILENLYERLQDIKNQIATLKKQEEATEYAIIGFGGSVETVSSENEEPISSDYPFRSTIKAKILYTLSKIKEGTAGEIAQFIAEQESKEKKDFFDTVTMVASSMYKSEGLIDARKEGKKNVYSLKENNEVHNTTV